MKIKTIDEVYEQIDTLIVSGQPGIHAALEEWANSIIDRCAEMTIYPNKDQVLAVKNQIK